MVKKVQKKSRVQNPTLHGLLISRSLSGTVVRTFLFLLLTTALVLVAGVAAATTADNSSPASGVLAIVIAGVIYLVFDLAYVIMANVRPLHPRLDRIVLPAGLVFSLVVLYAPLLMANQQASFITGLWITGAIALLCVLGTRLALLIASTNR